MRYAQNAVTLTTQMGLYIQSACSSDHCAGRVFLFVGGGKKVSSEEKKLWATELLIQKNNELGRLPTKDDFDEVTRSRIKAYLGPWPRALETAGLKAPKQPAPKKKRSGGKKLPESNITGKNKDHGANK